MRPAMLTRATLIAAAAALQCGCYGPVRDSSGITSTAVVGAGRAALVYHGYKTRPAVGIAAFPDGGIPLTLRDDFIVALAGPDGPPRKLAEFRNEALAGTGSVTLSWYAEDPAHIYATRAGQLDYSSHYLSDEIRIALNDGAIEHLKLRDQLAARGRDLGASGFGGFIPLDDSGTLLVGARQGDRQELWLRPSHGPPRKLADFDRYERRVGDDLVYSVNGPPFTTFAMNWRTGAVRPILRYKLHSTGLNWHELEARDDPAFQALNRPQQQSSNPAHVEVDGATVTYFDGDNRLWSKRVRF